MAIDDKGTYVTVAVYYGVSGANLGGDEGANEKHAGQFHTCGSLWFLVCKREEGG